MRNVSNSVVSTLVRHLPRVLNAVGPTMDNKTYNSVRLLKLALKKLKKIDNGQQGYKERPE